MYNHIHPQYVAEGLDLLAELSLSSTNKVQIKIQRSLSKYSRALSTELTEYIEKAEHPVMAPESYLKYC